MGNAGAAQFNLTTRGQLYDWSGTVLVAGTSQKLLSANANWSFIMIQNPGSALESLFVNFSNPATLLSDSIELKAGIELKFALPGFMPVEQINVTAATMGHAFTCKAA